MTTTLSISDRVRAIGAELDLALGNRERVAEDCALLREQIGALPGLDEAEPLLRSLGRHLSRRSDSVIEPVATLLLETADRAEDPWPLLAGLFAARGEAHVLAALDVAARRCESGVAVADSAIAQWAALAEPEGSPYRTERALRLIGRILRSATREPPDPVLALYLGTGPWCRRRLAARILDQDGDVAVADVARALLGADAHAFLDRYLRYTRATHLDLLALLAGAPGASPPSLESLRRAESICGEPILRDVIAALGWGNVNLGIEVKPMVGVRVGGAPPLWVDSAVAPLLEREEGARRAGEHLLVVAHGGDAVDPDAPDEAAGEGARDRNGADARAGPDAADPVSRFRAYNLTHAEALNDLLDLAPLTRERVARILERMDRLVGDFTALFSTSTRECESVAGVYRDLRGRIVSLLGSEGARPQLSPDLTRLVQMFEDPASPGDIRTLHGLKRYLHQRGLALGFGLVEGGRATNRRVGLALVTRGRVARVLRRIRYADFEGEERRDSGRGDVPDTSPGVPYPVAALADAWVGHLLYGVEAFPDVRVFCYGNEVHYFASFGSHPVFLRVDFAPPLQGGMVDLEYYGVSKNVLADHPNLNLDALQVFLRRLDFDVEVRVTRVHARYDKERTLDLEVLCEKAEALLRLLPYLMDLDWVIGDLRLSEESRLRVTEAWAERFARWGIVPTAEVLTRDRRGIRIPAPAGPAPEAEATWSGQGEYRDPLSTPLPAGLAAGLVAALSGLGLDPPTVPEYGMEAAGQLWLEQQVLRPIRDAVARGQIAPSPRGYTRRSADCYGDEHEAEVFADLLDAGGERLAAAASMARVVAPLERTLHFRTTGSVSGYEVQRSPVALRGGRIGLYVLRDPAGTVRLAMFAPGAALCRRRAGPDAPWERNGSVDVAALVALLRRNRYLLPGGVSPAGSGLRDAAELVAVLERSGPVVAMAPVRGEQVVEGLRVSPGTAAGIAVFGAADPASVRHDGAVIVAPALRPEDSPQLLHAVGVVTTGGSTLSHAALIATQFRKPALVVPGRWDEPPGGPRRLIVRVGAYTEEIRRHGPWRVTVRRDVRDREHPLCEGDVLVVDADAGVLRILGQDQETRALFDRVRLAEESARRLEAAHDEADRLEARGWRLRADHQMQRLLARLTVPALARLAVEQILLGEAYRGSDGRDRATLLRVVLSNERVAGAARESLSHAAEGLSRKHRIAAERAGSRMSRARSLDEVLSLRFEARRLGSALDDLRSALRACGRGATEPRDVESSDEAASAARTRLHEMRIETARAARDLAGTPDGDGDGGARARTLSRLRYVVRRLERLDDALGTRPAERDAVRHLRERVEARDDATRIRLADRRVIAHDEAGAACAALIGWKAANLAEVDRLLDRPRVPPWFAVTHRAFVEALEAQVDPAVVASAAAGPPWDDVPSAMSLRDAIERVLASPGRTEAWKSARIRLLWDHAPLSGALREAVVGSYRRLEARYVAVRSSAWEEDTEATARAGEFDTFLFVTGEEGVVACLRRAWSGLWTERAIQNRARFGLGAAAVGGGVIVQRVVDARASGVLQTVNLADGALDELVVNAGLGLGEGVVSGTVAADRIIVEKDRPGPEEAVRFRYVTADKRERIVFDRVAGHGTTRVACLHHQRLRPVLEYTELHDLVTTSLRLEEAFGHPLDIEFAIEGQTLWILQARPVAALRGQEEVGP
ncbi:MAG: PEP/pyruvate-binding domain-containing protein [Hyphomicrobiales bacterium]